MNEQNPQLARREALLAALRSLEHYVSTSEIARELRTGVRDVIHFRYVAGVAPGFIASDGQRYYAPADFLKIRAAFEASDLVEVLQDASPEALLMEEHELRMVEKSGAKRDWASEIASGAVTGFDVQIVRDTDQANPPKKD